MSMVVNIEHLKKEVKKLTEALEYVSCHPSLDEEDFIHDVINKALKGE